MKLTELNPIWIGLGGSQRHSGFFFLCPCCQRVVLICKCLPADSKEQLKFFEASDYQGKPLVLATKNSIWNWVGDFPDLTVSPSIDASSSGHWHGRITNGDIVK